MNHTILELVISSFVIIIITTINTCQDLSKIQSPISLPTGSFQDFSYHYDITGSAKRSTNNPSCDARALSAGCSLLAFRPCKLVGRVSYAVPRGDPSGLVSLVADGSDGVAPAGLYS